MNPSKKNLNGWILCPSKSFPGKFYYFNVANGETAWTLNEAEKKSLKNPTIQKIDNSHCYPEPNSSPPVGNSPPPKPMIQPNLYSRDIENNIYNPQNVYPNYAYPNRNISNVSTFVIQPAQFNQNCHKAAPPIQIQVPMIIGSDFHNSPQVVMILMNQNSSNGQLAINPGPPKETYPERDLVVQTEKIPLCQRFVNYEKPILEFQNNKIKQPFSQYNTSTPSNSFFPSFPNDQSAISPGQFINCDDRNQPKTVANKPIFKVMQKSPEKNVFSSTVLTTSHTNLDLRNNQNNHNNNNNNNIYNNLSQAFKEKANQTLFRSGHFETNLFKKPDIQIPTLKQNTKVDIIKSPINTNLGTPTQENGISNNFASEKTTVSESKKVGFASNNADLLYGLDENDLRRTLIGKKRKTIASENTNTEGKKIKTYKQENPAPTPKKKVTFNLVPEKMSDITSTEDFSCNGDMYNTASEAPTTMQQLKQLASPSRTADGWYVVIDTATLIEQLTFLVGFVQHDAQCYILIPSRVMSDTVAMSRGECRESRRVTLARYTMRALATPHPRVIVQPTNDEDINQISTSDCILKCCIEVMKQNSHVVLITNDMDIQIKAESYHIPCFNCEQIKEDSLQKPEVQFDIKKIKFSITNDVQRNFESPADSFKNQFGNFESISMQNKASNFEFPFKNNVANLGRTEWRQNTNANLTNDLSSLKITDNATEKKLNDPNSNKTISFFFQNENSKIENQSQTDRTKNSDERPRTVSFYFQNDGNKEEQRIGSIFKQANDKIKHSSQNKSIFDIDNDQQVFEKPQTKSSIFEIDGIEKIETNQIKRSIFDESFDPTVQKSNLESEKLKNKDIRLKKCNFESDFPTKNVTMKSTFEEKRNKEVQLQKLKIENEKSKNKPTQSKPSIFENNKEKNKPPETNSVFETEKSKSRQPIKPPFEKRKCENRKMHSKLFIFEKDAKDQKVLPHEINNEDLEDYVEKFFLKNGIEDQKVEDKKEEVICNFQQVMEECLSNVLQQSTSIHKSSPPYTLQEAMHCMAKVYGDHKTVRAILNILNNVLNSQDKITARNVLKIVACGMLLVRVLMETTPNPDSLRDAEESLTTIVRGITDKSDIDIQPVKTPVTCRNTPDEDSRRQSFVKDRSEVVKYLKKHFPAWANYEEIVENADSTPYWGQKYKDGTHIVRTYGKNIGMLKITKANTMSMNLPNVTTDNKETAQKENKNPQATIKLNNHEEKGVENKTVVKINENVDAKKVYKIPKIIRQPTANSEMKNDIKITRVIENIPKTIQNGTKQNKIKEIGKETTKEKQENIKAYEEDLKPAEPKVIRLFNNIKLTKEKDAAIDSAKSICNVDYTHGHTFGTENAGPKVVRSVQIIKEFEEKLKSQKPLDLDMLDYSAISESDDEKSTKTDNDCLSMTIDDEKNFIESNINNHSDYDRKNDYVDPKNDTANKFVTNIDYDRKNDHFDPKNDTANKQQQNPEILPNENNSPATNNESYSMSLDICVSNDFHSTNDSKKYINNTENHVKNYNCSVNENFCSDRVSCGTNNASYGTNDDVCNEKKDVKYEVDDFDPTNDTKLTQKDDTNDSGFENESLQAYSILKSFLYELNGSFKMVHNFIEGSIKEFRGGVLLDNKRRALHVKANATHAQITKIIDKLKLISQREIPDATSLQALIAGAGAQATEDKQISRYKYVVTQCLKQAEMLDRALKIMLSITDGTNCMLRRDKQTH